MTDVLSRISRVITNAAPTFRFVVLVNEAPYGVFTECDLPVVEWETQVIKEGGLNSHVHHLLGRRKETKLTLKNGVGTSAFISWYLATMAGVFDVPGMGLRRSVTVVLLNSLKVPVMTWYIENAMPTKWSGPQLKTSENSVAVQSLELSCGEITIIPGVGLG
ncbi:MAG: phage tail protein [Chloroflexi bacterium]|nr:phage tail protein [Chloroflexota bacterium]